MPPSEAPDDHALILFDGVCNLCNGFVNFVIDRDPAGYFKFAPLQVDTVQPLLQAVPIAGEAMDSVILIEDGTVYQRSEAALRIARRLTPPWPLAFFLIAVPRPLREWMYNWVAANRYVLFGQRDRCRMPTPELKARFLDYDSPSA